MYCIRIAILLLLAPLFGQAQSAQKPKTRFNHLAFMVQDLQKSTHFYTSIMGLDTIPEPFHDGKHTWLSISELGSLHLIEGPQKPTHVKGSHLCFSVASVVNFMEKLRKAGIAFESWAGEPNTFTLRTDGVKQVYLRDPDGYWLEVNDAQ